MPGLQFCNPVNSEVREFASTPVRDYTDAMPYRLRAASPPDAEAIARVHVASWRTTYSGIVAAETLAGLSVASRAEMWERTLARSDEAEFVLAVESQEEGVVGFASAGKERSGHPEYRGELFTIYLLAEHQRGGLGRQLFQAAVAGLLERDLSSMVMWMLKANPNRSFAERLGGQNIASKTYDVGGQVLEAVAYAWQDLRKITA